MHVEYIYGGEAKYTGYKRAGVRLQEAQNERETIIFARGTKVGKDVTHNATFRTFRM